MQRHACGRVPCKRGCTRPPAGAHRYVALVAGKLEGEGVVDYPLEGRRAVSLFRAVEHTRVGGGGGGCREAAAAAAAAAGEAAGEAAVSSQAAAAAGGDRQAVVEAADMLAAADIKACSGWVTRVHLWPKTGRTHQVQGCLAWKRGQRRAGRVGEQERNGVQPWDPQAGSQQLLLSQCRRA